MNNRQDQVEWTFPVRAPILFFAVITLASCVRFEPKPLSPSTLATSLEDRSLTNAELKTFLEKSLGRDLTVWPPVAWDFDMLTMVAFYWQPSLEVARAQWSVATAGERTAGQRPNPTLNIAPGFNSTTPMASPWLLLASLDVPLETAGKRGHRRVHAARVSDAARLNVTTVAWQVRSTLRSHLIELDAAGRREKLLKQQITLQEQIVKALEQRAQAGGMAASELFPVRISLIRLRLDLSEAERLRAESRARVAEALGVSIRALNNINFLFEEEGNERIAELTLDRFRSAALQSRADILGALAEYAAAQAALQLEIAKQYPDIHLQPGYEFDQGDNKWSLGLLIELPVFNQNKGPIAEAKARREEAAARFRMLQAKVLAEIDRAAEVLRVTQQTVTTLRSLANAQAQRKESVAAQFEAGAIERLEVLNAESEWIAAELVQVDGQARFHRAVVAMEEALQLRFNLPAVVYENSPGKAQ